MFGYLAFVFLAGSVALGSVATLSALQGDSRGNHAVTDQARTAQESLGACPAVSAFELAEPWAVVLPQMQDDEVWERVQAALRIWHARHVSRGDTTFLPLAFLERGSPAQVQTVEPGLRHARSCYFETRVSRRVDLRIAFRLTLWPQDTKPNVRVLELRWLSGVKGSGERRWQPEERWSSSLVEDLVQEIKKQTG